MRKLAYGIALSILIAASACVTGTFSVADDQEEPIETNGIATSPTETKPPEREDAGVPACCPTFWRGIADERTATPTPLATYTALARASVDMGIGPKVSVHA